jgi:hypothetical protein
MLAAGSVARRKHGCAGDHGGHQRCTAPVSAPRPHAGASSLTPRSGRQTANSPGIARR